VLDPVAAEGERVPVGVGEPAQAEALVDVVDGAVDVLLST